MLTRRAQTCFLISTCFSHYFICTTINFEPRSSWGFLQFSWNFYFRLFSQSFFMQICVFAVALANFFSMKQKLAPRKMRLLCAKSEHAAAIWNSKILICGLVNSQVGGFLLHSQFSFHYATIIFSQQNGFSELEIVFLPSATFNANGCLIIFLSIVASNRVPNPFSWRFFSSGSFQGISCLCED